MGDLKKGSHTVYDIQYHVVWTTKYRYKVLTGKIAERLRELLRQGCEARGIKIIRGGIGKDHVHMLISCPPTLAPCKIMQEEFTELRKRYWGQHLWSVGYFCRTVGTVTEEMIKQYIEGQGNENIEEIFKITE